MTLSEIAAATGGTLVSADPDAVVTDIVIDSREATPGSLYVSVIGEHFDGHDFIESAIRNGALCAVSDRDVPFPHIRVADTLSALHAVAAHYRDKFQIPVVGVTGSAGKTSTKEMLAAVLGTRFCVLKTEGNKNNQTGVPLTLFGLRPEHEVAIVEMGTNHFGEIAAVAKIAKPTHCLFTNIGLAHIEFFGSREGIFRGKTEMLSGMKSGGVIVANGDDDLLSTIPNAIRYGMGEHCDVRGLDAADHGLAGSDFTVRCGAEAVRAHVPAPGVHAVMNALAAVAVGTTLGMTLAEAAKGIEAYTALPGRMCVRKTAFLTVLDDAYNANPTSMMSSLDVLKNTKGRRVCILGDMLELGCQSAALHEEVGKYAAACRIDSILAVGPASRSLYEGAKSLAPNSARYFSDRAMLLSALPTLVEKGDTVLVKASLGMHLSAVVEALVGM